MDFPFTLYNSILIREILIKLGVWVIRRLIIYYVRHVMFLFASKHFLNSMRWRILCSTCRPLFSSRWHVVCLFSYVSVVVFFLIFHRNGMTLLLLLQFTELVFSYSLLDCNSFVNQHESWKIADWSHHNS